MKSKVVFMRRTDKEVEIFGGKVYIDIDGRNVGVLDRNDFVANLDVGVHKIKMYKSHTYDTFIGFAESEINIQTDEELLIKYSAPMIVTQPGNIVVSEYKSEEQVNQVISEREQKITSDYQRDEQKKQELEEKSRSGIIVFVVFMIIIAIIYGIEMASIY